MKFSSRFVFPASPPCSAVPARGAGLPARCRKRASGFTLVELLIVIVIIITLAVLSMTGFRMIRAAADSAGSIGVLRQLQIANHSYASDNNGRYVPYSLTDEDEETDVQWWENRKFLAYFTGDDTVFDKPENQTIGIPHSLLDPIVVRSKEHLWESIYASYGMNVQGLSTPDERSFLVGQISQPSRSAAFMTATDMTVRYSSRFLWLDAPVEGRTEDQKVAYRHSGKAGVVYYDGSSGLVSLGDIRAIDEQGAEDHPFWKADAK